MRKIVYLSIISFSILFVSLAQAQTLTWTAGGVMSNSKVDSDTIGGNITIIYCSTAVKNQTTDLPSVLLNWKD